MRRGLVLAADRSPEVNIARRGAGRWFAGGCFLSALDFVSQQLKPIK
jgi:hypothetical protein